MREDKQTVSFLSMPDAAYRTLILQILS